jgi:hypothetical protein
MKRVVALLIAMVAFSGMASAQTLGDFLKGAATEFIDKKTDGKISEFMLAGDWTYASPCIRLESDNELATLAGNAATTSLKSKLSTAYGYVGIKAGSHSLKLNNDDTFSMVVGKRTLSGTYTYNSETHAIELKFDTTLLKLSPLSGYAYVNGSSLDVAYDCTKLVNFLSSLGSNVSMLNSITQLVSNYDSIYIGFTYNK